MDDGIGPRGRLHDLAEVLDFPHQVLHAAVPGPRQAVQHRHFMAAVQQFVHHRLADLAQSSGDQDPHSEPPERFCSLDTALAPKVVTLLRFPVKK